MTEEIEKGDLVRFNPTKYVLNKSLKNRSWFSGFYIYKVVTLGHKWATLRMNCNNSRKLMPIDVWKDISKRTDFVKIVNGKPLYINR